VALDVHKVQGQKPIQFSILALLASGEPPTCGSLQNKPLLFDHSDGSCLIVADRNRCEAGDLGVPRLL